MDAYLIVATLFEAWLTLSAMGCAAPSTARGGGQLDSHFLIEAKIL